MPVDAKQIKADAPAAAPADLVAWVTEVAELTKPDAVYWCDGSVEERDRFYADMVEAGTFIKLNEELRPGSYYAKSDPVSYTHLDVYKRQTIGSRTMATPALTTASRSSRKNGVLIALTRTTTGTPAHTGLLSASCTSSRAVSFSRTDTESSRSNITWSAP